MPVSIDNFRRIQNAPFAIQEDPSFFETLEAQLGYQYDPIYEAFRNTAKYGEFREEGWDPLNNIPEGYEMFAETLVQSNNAEHMQSMIRAIEENKKRREILSRSSLWSSLGAGLLDPANLIAIPLGGPALTAGKAFARGAVGVGTFAAGQEALRYPFDPLAEPVEPIANIGLSAVAGGLITSAISIPMQRRVAAIQNTQKVFDERARPTTDFADDPWSFTAGGNIPGTLSTPYRRIVSGPWGDNQKLDGIKLFGDSGNTLRANEAGITAGPSVYQLSKVLDREWILLGDQMTKLWGKDIQVEVKAPGGLNITDQYIGMQNWFNDRFRPDQKNRRQSFSEWMTEVNRKYIMNDKNLTEAEAEAVDNLRVFYETAKKRLEDVELIGTKKGLQKRIDRLTREIFDMTENIKAIDAQKRITKNDLRIKEVIQRRLSRAKNKLNDDQNSLAAIPESAAEIEPYSPRYWDKAAIRKNRARIEQILRDFFYRNPFIYEKRPDPQFKVIDEKVPGAQYVKVELSTAPEAVNKRAKDAVDAILGDVDLTDVDKTFFGAGNSKHLRHRTLDIPNSEVWDFIIQDPMAVAKIYTHRTAGRYYFARDFGGRSIDDVIDENTIDMIRQGLSDKQIQEFVRDFRVGYDRVVGTMRYRDSSAIDNATATALKELAQVTYLGTAGLSAIPDFARVIMEHEVGDVAKGLGELMFNKKLKMAREDAKRVGEAVEISQNIVHQRFVDDITNNPVMHPIWDKAKSAFYIANGLAPITQIAKTLDATVRGHELIKLSIQLKEGKISPDDKTFLARYNIDEKTAFELAQAPFERTESGLIRPNADRWESAGISLRTRERFDTAMQSGILNTIMMGTPADKPIIVDGVAYIPLRIAEKFGLKEDANVKGYARIESGLLGLPFQFYSYALAATNKVLGGYAQGQIKTRYVGLLAALGLGYMSTMYKVPDFAWNQMEPQDKFARAFDASGVAALWSDLGYTAMHTSLALGGPNITGGFLSPKYPVKQDAWSAATGILGPGAGIVEGQAKAAVNFFNGDYEEGMKEFERNLPFTGLWIWKDEMNEFARAAGRF